jgi:hypothetical protein
MRNPLSFDSLTGAVASVFDAQPDGRQQEKVSYSLSDAGLAALSVFFMQSPSFLAYQRDMEKRKGTSNPWLAKDYALWHGTDTERHPSLASQGQPA